MATLERSFVGRDRELSRLREAIASARGGRGGLVTVTGDAGIGKTRLVEAATEDADPVWGRCWEAGGAPAFWPWIEVLRTLTARRGAAALRSRVEAAAREVARLVPELAAAAPEGSSGRPGEGASAAAREGAAAEGSPAAPGDGAPDAAARFALFDGVAQVLLAAAAAEPLVVVLDDLHAADPASLRLIELLAPRLASSRLLLVGTFRVADPGTDAAIERLLTGLGRRGEQLVLSGLDREAAELLAAASATAAMSPATLERVLRRAEGNPFFLQALASAAGDALPGGVQEAIGRRLEPLPAGTRATLAAGAVVGRDFSVARVALLRDVKPDEALALVEPAVRAGLVTLGDAGELRFAHMLIRDWLYAELEPGERAELHRREADALETRARADPELLQELAYHRAAAAPVTGAAPAVAACERAGQHALAGLAFEDAAAQYARALAIADHALEPLEPQRRALLLLALGDAHSRAGDAEAARDAFVRAANLARTGGLAHQLAHAALGFGRVVVRPGEVDHTLVALLEQAIAVVGDDEPALRSRLLARLARELHFGPGSERPRALAEEAVALAERDGDPAVRAFALIAWHVSVNVPDTVEERFAAAARAIAFAREAGDAELQLEAHVARAIDAIELGRPSDASDELDAADLLAAGLRQPALTWRVLLVRTTIALLAGRFDDAERLIAEAELVGGRARGDGAWRYRLLQESYLRELRGGLEELEPDMRAMTSRATIVWREMLTYLLAQTGRLEEARAQFAGIVAEDFGGPVDDMASLSLLGRCGDIAVKLGDRESVAKLHGRLLPYAERWNAAGGGLCTGIVHARLGPMDLLLGRTGEAVDHLRRAVEAHRAAGAAPLAALSEADLADALRAAGERDEAAALTDHALGVARALGMRPLADRLAATAVPASAAAEEARLAREGEVWVVAHRGATVRVRDRKGIGYLATLLERPHQEVAALDLASAGEALPDSDAGELLDAEATRAYRARVAELRDELEEARRFNDPLRAERASEELELLSAELSRAVGLGGRSRRAASASERARVSVTRALRSAIAAVAEQHPALGEHLEAAVRTGAHCRYAPAPGGDVTWRVVR